jgi:hypothetical protein
MLTSTRRDCSQDPTHHEQYCGADTDTDADSDGDDIAS